MTDKFMDTGMPMETNSDSYPEILAGPILRRLTPSRIVIWLAAGRELNISLHLYRHGDEEPFWEGDTASFSPAPLKIGERAYIYLIDYTPETPLPENRLLEYDLRLDNGQNRRFITEILPHIVYPGLRRPVFVVKSRIDHLFHGSCRKPHYPSKDALLRVDEELSATLLEPEKRPALLIMTGDQIYADDVGGPMLAAMHQAAETAGLYPEEIDGAVIGNSRELLDSPLCYYRREELLPRTKETKTLRDRFFGGVRKPIFTAASAHNHVVTLAEVSAMYLLIWSPALWRFVDLDKPDIPDSHRDLYAEERLEVEVFARGLPEIQRLLAHIPTYMIFDDHDVTDDWNLTRGWEEVAYSHPFSRRIIGNALIAYFLFQAWGNNPRQFNGEFLEKMYEFYDEPDKNSQDELINYLLDFEQWNYTLPTTPKMVVLDTRTEGGGLNRASPNLRDCWTGKNSQSCSRSS